MSAKRKGTKKAAAKNPKKRKKGASAGLVVTRRGAIAIVVAVCAVLGLVGFVTGRATGAPPGADGYRGLIEKWGQTYNVDANLIAAVVEAESSGRPRAVSSAGALGLMQLMPATGKAMAGEADLPYSKGRLGQDGDYNARLGSRYLGHVLDRFDQSAALALAAYNAGPSRVDGWIGHVQWWGSY